MDDPMEEMPDPAFVTHVQDQYGELYRHQAAHLGLFYKGLRLHDVPRWLAAVLTVVNLAGHHWGK